MSGIREKLTIVFIGKKMGYSIGDGWTSLIPCCVQNLIVSIYNFIACRIVGHDYIIDSDPMGGAVYGNFGESYPELLYYTHEICCDCGKRRKRRD